MPEIRFFSVMAPCCYHPWNLRGNPFLALGEGPGLLLPVAAVLLPRPGLSTQSGSSSGVSEASALSVAPQPPRCPSASGVPVRTRAWGGVQPVLLFPMK